MFFDNLNVAKMFPSSNGQDAGLSSRKRRFNSGREHQYFGDVAQLDGHLFCKQANAGSSPAISTNQSRFGVAAAHFVWGKAGVSKTKFIWSAPAEPLALRASVGLVFRIQQARPTAVAIIQSR